MLASLSRWQNSLSLPGDSVGHGHRTQFWPVEPAGTLWRLLGNGSLSDSKKHRGKCCPFFQFLQWKGTSRNDRCCTQNVTMRGLMEDERQCADDDRDGESEPRTSWWVTKLMSRDRHQTNSSVWDNKLSGLLSYLFIRFSVIAMKNIPPG